MDEAQARARKRATTTMVVVGVAVGIGLAVLATFGVLQVAYWSIAHCTGAPDADTRYCEQAGWVLDFWWAAFVPAVLALAWGLRWYRDRAWARLGAWSS